MKYTSSYGKKKIHSLIAQNKVMFLSIAALIVFFVLFKKYFMFLACIAFCIMTMQHKRYMSIVLGIDFCLSFALLASSSFGHLIGALVIGVSFFLGMVFSFEITKSPVMTFYGTAFYTFLALLYSFIPSGLVYSFPLLHIIIIEVIFFIGASFLGAPLHFLMKYISTNIIANLLFIQIFGGLLRLVF